MAERRPLVHIAGKVQELPLSDTLAGASSSEQTFETISANLKVYDATLNYTGEVLTSIVYDLGSSQTITKTLTYTSGVLTSITLSGNIPAGISVTKTLTYSANKLSNVVYS